MLHNHVAREQTRRDEHVLSRKVQLGDLTASETGFDAPRALYATRFACRARRAAATLTLSMTMGWLSTILAETEVAQLRLKTKIVSE